MTDKKAKSVIVATFVFCLSLAVGLCIAEVALRVKNKSMTNYNIEMWRYAKELKRKSLDPVLGHEHVPESEAVLQSVKIKIDENGMRCGDDKSTGALPDRRILFLGSSITLGWGVEYEKILTSLLNERFKADGKNTKVYNAGIGNYNTKRYVHLFLSKLKKIEPTDIVVHYFINDAEVLSSGGASFFVENSQLGATLKMAVSRFTTSTGIDKLVEYYKALYADNSIGYKDMIAAFESLREYCAQHSIRVYFLMTPDIHQLYDYPFDFIHDKMTSLAREKGFTYIDPLESFLKYDPKELWAMPGDPHPNEVGHEIMAEAVYAKLKED